MANLKLANVSATGSKIEVPKVVLREWIKENKAILSFPTTSESGMAYYLSRAYMIKIYSLSFP